MNSQYPFAGNSNQMSGLNPAMGMNMMGYNFDPMSGMNPMGQMNLGPNFDPQNFNQKK
jgi:hypothetical protein